jgi:MFS-type transporter involved in bile tolerance (Atg22 family)
MIVFFPFQLFSRPLKAAIGNGSVLISNVFLASSLIYLASQEAGCVDAATGRISACDTRVYGFYPSSLVNSIYAIASLVAAFFMPLFGAIIDYTDHRRTSGRMVAFLLWAIQTVQIGTVHQTWFPMAVLQAIAGVLFEFHFLLSVSYLPDIIRYDVSYEVMNRFNRAFFGLQFGSQAVFLLIVVSVSTWIVPSVTDPWGSVKTGQFGQGVSSLVLLIVLPLAWTRFPHMKAKHRLPEGHRLIFEGFRQNYRTAKAIATNHRPLKWFLTTVVLAEAGITPLIPTMITIMSNVYRYKGNVVGIVFFVALVSTIPGIVIGAVLSRRYNPQVSQRINLGILLSATLVIAIVMDRLRAKGMIGGTEDTPSYTGYLFSLTWGLLLGWFYTTQQLFFTASLPPKQEAELSGFYVYCTIILTWVPTLISTVMLNAGIAAQWTLIPLVIFQFLAFCSSLICPGWSEVEKASKDPLRCTMILDRHTTTALDNEEIEENNVHDDEENGKNGEGVPEKAHSHVQ